MLCKVKGFEIKCKSLVLLLSGLVVLWQMSALATQSVTLGWSPSGDPNVASYNIYYGTVSHVYAKKVSVGIVTNATISGLVVGATYFFAATTTDVSGDESAFSNEASYAVPLSAITPPAVVNQPPTLNALGNVTINENAAAITVALSGISSGVPTTAQTLAVTAVSSNPSLIPNPTVNYTSPNATGTLTFAPATNVSGKAIVTVIVNDSGATNNVIERTFTVTVTAVNQPPTLNPISNVIANENASSQTIALSGITSGTPNEKQTLAVTAVSSSPTLIPNPTVNYTSPNTTGTLTFTPMAKTFGTATITVTVNDGGKSANLVTQTFNITINPVNQPPTLNAIGNISIKENAASQTIALSGISSGAPNEKQTLTLTAISSSPTLIPNPIVKYTSPNATGTLTFTPVAGAMGTATVTVTANDGGTSNNIIARTFTITVATAVASGPKPAATTTTTKPSSPNVVGTTSAVAASQNALTASSATSPALTAAKTSIQADAYFSSTSSPAKNVTVEPLAPATLSQPVYANGQYAFYVSGTSGSQYVVQASTNLVDWVSVETNTAPFTFVDANAGQFTHQFYRAVGQ
jgi:hypothetical protein